MISIVLEKPTDIDTNIKKISAFKFLFGLWALLVPILTNGYLGLSITSISSPLESISVTKFSQLTQPGCDWNNIECPISRIEQIGKYLPILGNYWHAGKRFWNRDINPRFSNHDINLSIEALRNQSIRRFDEKQDFVLLPYSFEENIFNNAPNPGSTFCSVLEWALRATDLHSQFLNLPKLKFKDKTISSASRKTLRLFDLIDPWHIPHPYFGNFSDTMYLEKEWDIEHALVHFHALKHGFHSHNLSHHKLDSNHIPTLSRTFTDPNIILAFQNNF